jgi:hypothetical protein
LTLSVGAEDRDLCLTVDPELVSGSLDIMLISNEDGARDFHREQRL